LEYIELAWRLLRVAGRYGIKQQAQDKHQQQVKPNKDFSLNLNGVACQNHGDYKDKKQGCKERGKKPGQHRSDVFNNALLVLNQPGSDDNCSHCPAGQHPFLNCCLCIETDGLENKDGQSHQNSASEGDKSVVDKPFARKAHIVHSLLMAAPLAASIGVTDHQPQGNWKMNGSQYLGLAASFERQ